jgi:transposase InsO family protein/transposase-like protein
MPWKETCRMDERERFVKAYLETGAMSALCREFGISRKSGYKWTRRYWACGEQGLVDRSRRPQSSPTAVEEWLVDGLVRARKEYPFFGPRKLHALLVARNPGIELPAPSTIGEILRRHGLVRPRKRRRAVPPMTQPFGQCSEPNDVWCTDFKGHFPVGDRLRCYPLTLSDAVSRYLLRCDGVTTPDEPTVKPLFESAFREFGLPDAMRSDNGPPFASTGLGRLSRLAVWWVRLGIRLERIEPGHPEQNGRHERMHRTLKEETASPPEVNLARQQLSFDRFRHRYNDERPHEALGQITPASVYTRSVRSFPDKLPALEYPDEYELRRVQPNGAIHWRGHSLFLTRCLENEVVGLKEVDFDRWQVYFGPLLLGGLDERSRPPRIVVPRKKPPAQGPASPGNKPQEGTLRFRETRCHS